MPTKRTRDLIIQTTDGKIYFISEDKLGEPVAGAEQNVRKLRSSLAKCKGQVLGLRTAVMGFPLPAMLGEDAPLNMIDSEVTKAVARRSKTEE
ncbi:MAG TPA: hypothetical protein VE650_03670 [Acetobacteraceae bacterium]|nr:hypothetical protein [Acetobacteraceae bacterium]